MDSHRATAPSRWRRTVQNARSRYATIAYPNIDQTSTLTAAKIRDSL
ncbi:MAG: hypothetical protein MI923_07735 [Phycisphaerales bacterium]|nr:hypothetical protein [Phycisphaerales bacterium]